MANRFEDLVNSNALSPIGSTVNRFEELEKQDPVEQRLAEGDWYDDPVMAGRMIIDGVMLGWSDELASHAGAAIAMINNEENTSYEAAYDNIYGEMKAEEAAYRQQYPMASTTLNIAGGIISPVNWIAPGSGLAATTTTVGRLGYQAARGGIEGAIGGAGSAGEGQRAEGAALGSAFGFSTGFVLQGGGWLFDKSTSRKLAQELETANPLTGETDFIPLTLAANPGSAGEEMIHSLYKDLVGSAWGGSGKIAQQEDVIINAASRKATVAQDALDKAKRNAKEQSNFVTIKTKQATSEARRETADTIKTIRAGVLDTKENLDEAFKATKVAGSAQATKEFDTVVKETEEAFRVKALADSMPSGATGDDIDLILTSATPNLAMKRLDDLWVERGFEMLKNRKFQINPKQVTLQIRQKLKDDPMFASLGKSETNRITDQVSDYLAERTSKGWIDGEDLSAIRSRLGQYASQRSDVGGESAVLQSVFREMQDVLNGAVKKQLSGKALKQFEEHTTQWKSQTVLRTAVNNASRKAGSQGRFTPDDWVSAIGKNSPKDLRQGTGPLRKDADDVAILMGSRDEAITKTAENVILKADSVRRSATKKARNEALTAIKREQDDLAKLERTAQSKQDVLIRRAESKARVAELKNQVNQLDTALASLTSSATGRNVGLFRRLAAGGVLGAGYQIGNLATGTVMSRMMSTQSFQKAVAGQTGVQKAGQSLIQSQGQNIANMSTGLAAMAGQQAAAEDTLKYLREQ